MSPISFYKIGRNFQRTQIEQREGEESQLIPSDSQNECLDLLNLKLSEPLVFAILCTSFVFAVN